MSQKCQRQVVAVRLKTVLLAVRIVGKRSQKQSRIALLSPDGIVQSGRRSGSESRRAGSGTEQAMMIGHQSTSGYLSNLSI